MIVYETNNFGATLIFLPVDGFALGLGTRGPRPSPIGPFKYVLTGQVVGAAMTDLNPPLELVAPANPSGYVLFFAQAKAREPASLPIGRPDEFDNPGPTSAPIRRVALASGTYRLQVVSKYYAPLVVTTVVVPDPALNPAPGAAAAEPMTLTLMPGYLYPFPAGTTLLRGTVAATDGSGVSGAIVTVDGVTGSYQTDATGQWVIAFPASQATGSVTLRIDRPNVAEEVLSVPITAGASTSFPATALRGAVVKSSGLGIAGAAVSVSGQTATVQTASDGGWTYLFPDNQAASSVNVTAQLAGTSSQTQNNIPVAPGTTVTVPAFRFT